MIKDVIVHLTGSEQDEANLALAASISEDFEAHLGGVYVNLLPAETAAANLNEPDAADAEADDKLRRLRSRFGRLGIPHDVQRLDVSSDAAGDALANRARLGDLFVATRPSGDEADGARISESVLFSSGRACLFVPPEIAEDRSFGTVIIAWDGSREAARAVAEAMPFLERAGEVTIVIVRQEDNEESGGLLARHLRRHRISAAVSSVGDEAAGPGEALLREADRLGGDLLVMGGGGYSTEEEWILGTATRHVLSHSNTPIFMAR